MKSRITTLLGLGLLALLCFPALSDADGIRYARHPALSPDGETIAFTYMGDIWSVPAEGGVAHRLTVHEAEDVQPHYSPDGKMILFSSRRYNNFDVFVMPAQGGPARQLTYHSSVDHGSGWCPGSDTVLFHSRRNSRRAVYKVGVDGGTPVLLAGTDLEHLYNARVSSDGRYLWYNSGSGLSRWWRRDLRSSRNADIFVQDRTQREFSSRRLTYHESHDIWPIVNEERAEVYFVSCRNDWAQIWMVPLAGGDPVPLTDFTDDGVQWLNGNPQGTKLVFEQAFRIWIMDPADPQPRPVPIEIKTDERDNMVRTRTFNGDVEWFAISPDDKKIAAIVHGEVFLLPAEDPEEGKRVTNTPARERFVSWGSDSKTLFYASDRNDNYDIYAYDVVSGQERQLTDHPDDETKPLASPDGKHLVLYRGLQQVIRYDLKEDREMVWVEGPFLDFSLEPTLEYDWSPDSRWLALSMGGPTFESDIYAVSLQGELLNLSRYIEWNIRPRFSKDGKLIYFISANRWGRSTYAVDLVRKPEEFHEAALDSLFIERSDDKEVKEDEKDAEKGAEQPPEVVIDTTRITLRRHRPYESEASTDYPVLTPDGKRFVFVASLLGKPEVWSVNADDDDPDLTQLTHTGKGKSHLMVTSDSKDVVFLEGGNIKRCSLADGKVTNLSFTARIDIDRVRNNSQKFRESWQMLNSYFYDTTFHGADWELVRRKYEPLVEHIRTNHEFCNLLMEMMGELRASHLWAYSSGPDPDETVVTGRVGIELDPKVLNRRGRFRVSSVTPETPAAVAGVKEGDYIHSVNDTVLTPDVNYCRLLAGTRDRLLRMTVTDASGSNHRVVELKPISASRLRDLRYEAWVARSRTIVDSLSGGRLAYLHIRGMNQKGLRRFQEELVSIAESKEAAVIDVRHNGGGWTAVHVLGELIKSPYILRTFRGQPAISENKMRSKAIEKPMVLLINNYSGSNAEIFTEGFRKLGLGKIIGTPTGSGVIGTASFTLIDGSRVRRPSWGAYTTEMEDTDMQPRRPDILVENLPDDYINGRDPQLAKAVEVLLEELK